MTVRRRFFPSRPVQQVPGQSVELALQLRPAVSSVAATASTSDPGTVGARCTGWISTGLQAAPSDAYEVDELSEGHYEFGGAFISTSRDYTGLISSTWLGTPALLNGDDVPRPVCADDFVCTDLVIETSVNKQFPGRAYVAVAPGCTWAVEWDSADPENPLVSGTVGHVAHILGETLMVDLLDTGGGDSDLEEVLTATATSGAVVIAVLSLAARRIEY